MSEKIIRTIKEYGKTRQYIKVCSCSGETYKPTFPNPVINLKK